LSRHPDKIGDQKPIWLSRHPDKIGDQKAT
jgi:hypothetical protein